MSVQRCVWIECDGCGAQVPGHQDCPTVGEARALARQQRWVHRKGRDLCEECR